MFAKAFLSKSLVTQIGVLPLNRFHKPLCTEDGQPFVCQPDSYGTLRERIMGCPGEGCHGPNKRSG